MAEPDAAEQSYYPSAKLRLILRFEEFASPVVAAKAPKTLVHRLKGTKSTRGALQVQQDPEAPAGTRRLLLVPESGTAAGGPQKEDASSDGLTWVIGGIIPKQASWKRNGIRTADELKAVIKFIDLPFDPRCIRSIAVEYYLGTFREDDYMAGIGGTVTAASDAGAAGRPLMILPDGWIDEQGRKRSNLRFQGWVDEWENEWTEDEEPIVTIQCRDNTKVLIDQDAPPKLAIAADKPIDEALAAYLSNFPQFAGMSVQYLPNGVDPPTLGSALAKTAFKPQLGPVHSKAGGTGGTVQKVSVWDYITDVAGALGHIARVEGTTVLIQRARTITSSDFGQRADDPFVPRTLASGLRVEHRHFIYGRNVLNYKIARRYGKQAPQNVEVRSYNGKRKKVLVVRYPIKGDAIVTDVNPGDGHSERKYLVWRVSGIEDEKSLRVIAQSIYETIGRNELAAQIVTKNLASFGGGNVDPDVLDAAPGDAFELLVNRDAETNTLTAIEESLLVSESALQLLEAAGYSGGLAAAYAKVYSDSGVQSTFRMRDMAIEWSIDDGVGFTIGGVNYVEVRADKLLPPGEEFTAEQSRGTTNRGGHAVPQPGTI